MSYRARGGGGFGKQLPFELFPEIDGLVKAKDVEKEAKALGVWYLKFDMYYKSSPYYLEAGDDSSKKLKTELETFSNRGSGKKAPKGRLSDFIYMDPIYVPGELAKGDKTGRIGVKRVKWNPETDKLHFDDLFAKKEQEEKVKEANPTKREEEEEEDVIEEEEDDELDDDDDYIQNEVFDDDEDPFNEEEDNNVDDEGGEFS